MILKNMFRKFKKNGTNQKLMELSEKLENQNQQLSNIKQAVDKALEIDDFILKRERKIQEISEFSLNRSKEIQELSGYILKRNKEIQELSEYILRRNEKIQELNEYILPRIKNCQELIKENKHKYNNDYERQVIKSFNEFYEREDFKEKFLNLIYGLDDCDVDLIVKILQRQRLVKDAFHLEQDIFSEEEQKKICTLKRELKMEIFKVCDGMYCYKHYMLPINHFEASVFVYKHGIDCIQDIERLRKKDILDVGGFIGDSILVLKPLTDKTIISFEAMKKNYNLMKQTVKINELENVVLENMALGSEISTIEMENAGPSSSFETNTLVESSGKEMVSVTTLDDYMVGKDYQIGLIKVDIEGAEQAFLHGARKTIEKFKPVLLLSIYHKASDFFEIKPMIESWNLGYKFKVHKPVDYSISREVLLIAEVR